MNDNQRTDFQLACLDARDPAPVLTNVELQGRLDAVLFEFTLRQTYRNSSDRVLEVVYTFPLPANAVLLGFAAELNGERQEGLIVARQDAERDYEEAIEEGDAPVLLQAQYAGPHTANIGNLKPGDEIVLEARLAQLLNFEQGRLRVSIPTTIAPRYGDARKAGLEPQQVPLVSAGAQYPLSLKLMIGPALAGARIECPTHPFACARAGAGGSTAFELAPGAWLDRDVVVIVTPREPHPSLLVRAKDAFNPAAPIVMMAALQLPRRAARDPISLKLLVDCSGSMIGDSIDSARAALHGIVARLDEGDSVSLSRFGSRTEHLFAPAHAKAQAIRHLQRLIDTLDADQGDTEMEAALNAVFELAASADRHEADVLLITDGAIWQIEEAIAAARRSNHRVFVIGVGSSPVESGLQSLAKATRGACDFVTPGEALEAAAPRMLDRMRQPVFSNARIDWAAAPVWTSSPITSGIFCGDTVIALAGFSGPVEPTTIRLLADGASGGTVELARSEASAPCLGDSLPRIAAARRIDEAAAADAHALELALDYQLMSVHTNCILVHRRADVEKATERAELHRVRSMVEARRRDDGETAFFCTASRERFDTEDPSLPTQEAIGRGVGDHLRTSGQLDGVSVRLRSEPMFRSINLAIEYAGRLGLTLDQTLLLLAHWVNTRPDGLGDADLAKLFEPFVSAIDPALVETGLRGFSIFLSTYQVDRWD